MTPFIDPKAYYCVECGACFRSLESVEQHVENACGLVPVPGKTYETGVRRRERLDAEAAERARIRQRREAVADFECAHFRAELELLGGAEDFLRACRGLV